MLVARPSIGDGRDEMTSRTFGSDRTAARQARTFVEEEVAPFGAGAGDTVVLLTSEVVSNALIHAGSAPTVTVTVEGRRVRVEVADSSPALPVRKRYGPDATTGRGMMLLDALADAWGAVRTASGKYVWFELDVVPDPADGITGTPTQQGKGVDLEALAASLGEHDVEWDPGH